MSSPRPRGSSPWTRSSSPTSGHGFHVLETAGQCATQSDLHVGMSTSGWQPVGWLDHGVPTEDEACDRHLESSSRRGQRCAWLANSRALAVMRKSTRGNGARKPNGKLANQRMLYGKSYDSYTG